MKNNMIRIRIVKKLGLRRIYLFNGTPSWQWKNLLFPKDFVVNLRMNPHVAIFGESGGGKSNACRLIVKDLCRKNARVMILDPNGDYLGIADEIGAEVYDAARNGINIFDLEGLSQNERISELMNIFRNRLRLGYVQAAELKKCLEYSYWIMKRESRAPTLKEVLYTIRIFQKKAGTSEAHVLETLHERLSLLSSGRFVKNTNMERVMRSNSIFLLSTLHTGEAQSVYMEGLLRKVYSNAISSSGRKMPIYIVIDEARKLAESAILGRLASEGRKYGIGIITISQTAKEIGRNVVSNSSLLISFYQREPAELNYMSNFIAGGNELNRFVEVKKAIRNLRVGEAIALDSNVTEPYILKFGLCSVMPTSLRYHISSLSATGASEKEILRSSLALGFAESEIKETLSGLLSINAIKEVSIKEGGLSGAWYISDPMNSPEHDLFVNLMSKKLSNMGIMNEVYNSSYGPDIIAYSRSGRIAYEYETGSKDIEQTRKMIEYRKKAFERVVVVVDDNQEARYRELNGIELVRRSQFFSA